MKRYHENSSEATTISNKLRLNIKNPIPCNKVVIKNWVIGKTKPLPF